jgi:ATP-dependent Clp protease ATP-binding subunit ClpA
MSARSIGFGDMSKDAEFKAKSAIEKLFSPEFRNRLDSIITFHSLTIEIMEMIVDKFINEVNEQLSNRRVVLSITQETRHWLAKKGYDQTYGARPLSRLIQVEIKDKLADEILFGRLSKGGSVTVDIKDNQPVFSY